jgi:pSer/pThr/pTyr-binding forkhead associated (FHA) protein
VSTTSDYATTPCTGLRLVASCADGASPVCELGHTVSILGSGEWCDVILESPDVATSHAAIVKYGGTGYLCDLGAKGGATLNGRMVRWARLAAGDRVGVGPFEFVVQIDSETPNNAMTQPIFGLLGDEEIGLVTSIDPVLLIGSDGGSDIVLNDAGVHARHCLVVWTDRGPVARDLSGDRLSFVNGKPMSAALLHDGATIGVGSHEFIFEIENEPTFEQSVGGRFAAPTPMDDPSLETSTPEFVAGKFGGRLAELEDKVEELANGANTTQQGSSIAQSAIITTQRPNYFEGIIEDADADLTELAEMEKASPSQPDGPSTTADHSETVARSMANDEIPMLTAGMTPEAILRKAEQLQQKTTEMRRRVSEAQRALDQRAQKHREEILEERRRLREKRTVLQMQAKALVEASKIGRPEGDASRSVVLTGESTGGSVLEIHDEPAQKAFVEYVANESNVRKLLSGGLDLIEQSDFNAKETDRILNDPRSYADEESIKTLEDRVAELIRAAQAERKEIERGEALVETLRFETERQRRSLTRRQEKLQLREKSIEERFRSLAKARDAIRKERAPLMARLKALDADESVIRERMGESEALNQDLVKEADAIDEMQEGLETRERALLHKLELERQRLLARQTQLKRKATQLAKAAREKRLSIEKGVLNQQAELESREAELRARRMQIEETARGELEKTAGDIEQVLSVRLSEIESELETRRMDLDTKVQELAGLNHAHLKAARDASDPIDAPLRRIASEFSGYSRVDDEETDLRILTLDNLAAEVDAFSRKRDVQADVDDCEITDSDDSSEPVILKMESQADCEMMEKADSIPLEPESSAPVAATTEPVSEKRTPDAGNGHSGKKHKK